MSNSIIRKAEPVRHNALNFPDLSHHKTHHKLRSSLSQFLNQRLTLLSKLRGIDENILNKNHSDISKVFLFGEYSFNNLKNTSILIVLIECITSTKRFDALLYQN